MYLFSNTKNTLMIAFKYGQPHKICVPDYGVKADKNTAIIFVHFPQNPHENRFFKTSPTAENGAGNSPIFYPLRASQISLLIRL